MSHTIQFSHVGESCFTDDDRNIVLQRPVGESNGGTELGGHSLRGKRTDDIDQTRSLAVLEESVRTKDKATLHGNRSEGHRYTLPASEKRLSNLMCRKPGMGTTPTDQPGLGVASACATYGPIGDPRDDGCGLSTGRRSAELIVEVLQSNADLFCRRRRELSGTPLEESTCTLGCFHPSAGSTRTVCHQQKQRCSDTFDQNAALPEWAPAGALPASVFHGIAIQDPRRVSLDPNVCSGMNTLRHDPWSVRYNRHSLREPVNVEHMQRLQSTWGEEDDVERDENSVSATARCRGPEYALSEAITRRTDVPIACAKAQLEHAEALSVQMGF